MVHSDSFGIKLSNVYHFCNFSLDDLLVRRVAVVLTIDQDIVHKIDKLFKYKETFA